MLKPYADNIAWISSALRLLEKITLLSKGLRVDPNATFGQVVENLKTVGSGRVLERELVPPEIEQMGIGPTRVGLDLDSRTIVKILVGLQDSGELRNPAFQF